MPHTTTTPPALQDGDLLAAIDLGSNSFHMVIARYTLGQLRVIDRLRETVRMADGLDGKGGLSAEARQRALECLARFGQRIRNVPPHRVRALATNTVRQLRSPQAFLMPAETALGHAIEVVSGREEARLIYLGVAHAQPPKPDQHRLVIDIGGGSTEFIIGKGMQTLERESLQAGCIASTRRFFPGGKLSKKRWKDALAEIGREFQPFASKYRALGWQEALGSSGTHKAISEICATMKLSKGAITAEALPQLRDELLKAKKIDDIVLPGLSADRRPIIAGGILVLGMSVRENFSLTHLSDYCRMDVVNRKRETNACAQYIRSLGIKTPSPEQKVLNLSGGNQQKVIVARELSRDLRLTIAAQPTRGVDVGSIEYIHSRIVKERDAGTAVLIVSTELEEVMALSDRLLVMYRGKVVAEVDPKKVTPMEVGLYMAGSRPDSAVLA